MITQPNADNDKTINVYYDGACSVCAGEMAYYRKRDPDNRLCFFDISDRSFSSRQHGLVESEIQRKLHVKLADGRIYTGIDAFIAIWEHLPGFAPLAKIFRNPILHPLGKLGYYLFTRIRPYLRRK